MLISILVAAVALFVIGVLALAASAGPIILLRPQRCTPADLRNSGKCAYPDDFSLPSEPFSVQALDNLTLRGWIIPYRAPRGTVIFLHGVGECKSQGLPVANLLFQNGYTTVLVDSRAHGESDGDVCTYGYREKDDLRRIIDELEVRARIVQPLVLMGISMGAAIALQTAAIEPRINGVIAEASFINLKTAVLEYEYKTIRLRSKLLQTIIVRRAERYANFSAEEVCPLSAVRKITVPILFIHGTSDPRVSYKASELLFQHAAGPKELFLVQGAHHTDVWKVAGAEYEQRLLRFLEKVSG
ncbi:MAG: alpha/beta hydrolase [Bacteroidota bacterium]